MGRGLDGFLISVKEVVPAVALCSFEGPGRAVSRLFPVALARGKHLFPFRTEQLSPSAPMVLGPQGPGRVGRRRFLCTSRPRAARRRPYSGLSVLGRAPVHGAEAEQRGRARLPRATFDEPPAQRRPVRVGRPLGLVPVDLPVDLVVVLEQQERAGQPKRTEGAPRECLGSSAWEHLFVR
jgi:hypothetical protein